MNNCKYLVFCSYYHYDSDWIGAAAYTVSSLPFCWTKPSVMMCLLACSRLKPFIDCVGCKPWQSVFPMKAMEVERYYSYNNHRLFYYSVNTIADYLTPMRLYDLCRVDEEGNCDCKCIHTSTIYNTLAKDLANRCHRIDYFSSMCH